MALNGVDVWIAKTAFKAEPMLQELHPFVSKSANSQRWQWTPEDLVVTSAGNRGVFKMFCITRLPLTRFVLCCAMSLLFTLAVIGQPTKHALTNEDVVKLVKDGFADDVIVAMIEANDTAFDVSVGGVRSLREAGISSKVMEAMLKAEAKNRQASAAQASSYQPGPNTQSASPPATMVPNPAMSAMGGSAYAQQMMAMAMSMGGTNMGGGMSGMLDTRQLPPLTLMVGDVRQQVRPSIAQIAHTDTKGDSMPGTGSEATGMLMGLGRQALSFGAIGGGMFAGPAAGLAMGAMGGLGGMGRHGPPKVTYVWALPGEHSAYVVANTKPRFEMSFGNLLGIDPDAYEPQLVRLVNSKDNWRLVGATKSTMGQISTEAYEKVTEARIAVKYQRLDRGQVQIEPKQPLEPGEYAVVLRAIHPGKRSEGSLGGGAETTVFFSVWDFSVRDTGQ
jgi:hypothetical protein